MNLRSRMWLLAPGALALFVSLGSGGAVTAADLPPRVAAPATIPDSGVPCATCNTPSTGGASSTCTSCGKSGCKHHSKPYVTHLCPGACFGYFQTQWHRWEDVCPLPYQGVGMNDAPTRTTPPIAAPPVLRPTTDPKTTDPKPKTSDTPLPKPAPVPGTAPDTTPPVPPKTTPNNLPIPPLPKY
jgi:hypothetical protein